MGVTLKPWQLKEQEWIEELLANAGGLAKLKSIEYLVQMTGWSRATVYGKLVRYGINAAIPKRSRK